MRSRLVTRHRLRVLEALVALTIARVALRVVPFPWIAARVGRAENSRADDQSRRATTDPVSAGVRWALRAGARRLPWRSSCLTRALAGRMMLARRGVPSALVFGVTKEGERLSAHAWLMTADGTVCGGREAPRFRPLAALRSSTPLVVWLAVMAGGATAWAQDDPPDPVAEAPLHLGPTGVAPTFAITNLGVDTNVFNSTTDPRQDFTLTASPGAKVWLRTQRGLLSVDTRVDFNYYATYASERSANVSGLVRYEYPFTRFRPFVSYSALTTRERPGYEIDVRARRLEDAVRLGAIVPMGSVSTLEVTRRHDRVVFDGEAFFVGQALKQALDRTLDGWEVGWRQPLTVISTWLVRASYEQERFEFASDRNSNSLRLSSGFELGQLALIRGNAFVGYRRLTGAGGGALAEFSGLTTDIDVQYTAPSQSRLGFAVQRDLNYSFELERPYYVQTGWTVSAAQRIIGRWDMQANVGRDRLAYRSAGPGMSRLDRISRLGGGVGYEMGDSVRIGFDVLMMRRRSPLLARDYRAYKTGVSVTYGY